MKKINSVLLHIFFWVLFITPSFLFLFYDQDIPPHRIWFNILSTSFTIINFYFFYSFLIPLFNKKEKIRVLIILTVVFVIVYPLIQQQFFSFINDLFEWKPRKFKHSAWFYATAYTSTFLFTGLAYSVKFAANWVTDRQIKTELINQNQASELALLRSQINPHFLFNTLNNIYSLVISKSEHAPEAMMKLSDIMRYMLYESNTDKVFLTKEINYLKSYIEILQLRVTQTGFITFNVSGNVENMLIAPMLLVPFVENAFKHCNKKSPAPGIEILLEIDENLLKFILKNSVKQLSEVSVNVNGEKTDGGIGIKNIKRRLDLLYPNKHNLILEKRGDYFYSELTIKLNDH